MHLPAFFSFRSPSRRWAGSLLLAAALLTGAPSSSAESMSYAEWLDLHELRVDADGSGAALSITAGDGIPNLFKFGLGLDPSVPGFGGRLSAAPLTDAGNTFLALTFLRPDPAPAGIVYRVEFSDTLAGWEEGGQEIANTALSGVRTITVRDSGAVETDTSLRFIRLSVGTTAAPPVNTGPPLLSGAAEVGQTLAASAGTWSGGNENPSLVYQWTRNGEEIPGAETASYVVKEADLGATLALRVIGFNSAGTATVFAAATGPVVARTTPAPLEIRADGYTAELYFPGLATGGAYDLAPDTAPKVLLSVRSPGFDANGAATTVTRQIVGTVPLRQPFPNENSPTETAASGGVRVTIALSDRIYSGDVVTECGLLGGAYVANAVPSPAATLTTAGGHIVNSSALAYPKPIANWLAFPRERAYAGSTDFALELLAFHRHARAGRQVACVELIATDEHGNSVSVKTSAMLRSTRVTTGNPIAVYRTQIPLATLTQGDHVTVRAKVYPFVGNASAVLDGDPSADGAPATVPSGFGNYTFLNDKTGAYGTVYAYVSPGGSDASGVASEGAATAAASPFLTIYGAASAVKAKNNTLYGHNDLGGGVIRLNAGTYAGFGASNLNLLGAGKTWLTIEAAPGDDVSTVSLEPGTRKNPGNWVLFRNLSLTPTGASHTVLDAVDDGNVDGPPTVYGAYEGVRIHGLSVSAPIIYRVGLRYFIGCDMKDLGRSLNAPFSTSREHTPLLAGSTLSYSTQVASGGLALPTWTNVGNVVSKGFYFCEVTGTVGSAEGSTRVVAPKFGILAFNSAHGSVTTHSFGFKQPVGAGGGLAIVQNLFEFITNTSSPCFNLGADSAVMSMDNVVVQHMTVAGARTNFLYNDDGALALSTTGSKRVNKNGSLQYSLLHQYNCKTDTFVKPGEGADGARIGNWEPHHGVGQEGNLYLQAAANGPAAPYVGPGSWNGMYLGLNVTVAGAADFVNDLSLAGDNTGGGNYRPGPASAALQRVPAGFATLPFDLDGTPRHNDGNGAAGAYERE